MARHKDFGSPKTREEPITFDLHGEHFEAIPAVPGQFLLDVVKNQGDEAATADMITSFFEEVLEDDSWERFEALLKDKKRIVTIDTLVDIVSWLMEEYADRPETRPGV